MQEQQRREEFDQNILYEFFNKNENVQNDNEKCKLHIDVLMKYKYPLWQRFKFMKPKLYDVFLPWSSTV